MKSRDSRCILRTAALSLCLFAAAAGAAYAWHSGAVNSGNRITVGKIELVFAQTGASEKYFETELQPVGAGAFSPADYVSAQQTAAELGSAKVADSVVTLCSQSDSALDYALTLDGSGYDNSPAVIASLRFWCFDAETGETKQSGAAISDFDVSGSLEPGGEAELHLFAVCLENGFAEGKSLRFDLRAEADAGGGPEVYPAEIENGGFEEGGGWTPLVPGDDLAAYIAENTSAAPEINKEGSYFLASGRRAGFGFRSSTFTLSGSGWIRFRMSGYGVSVLAFLADGTPIGEFRYDVPPYDETFGMYVMRTYAADLSAHLGSAMYLEVRFGEAGEDAFADAFSASDPAASAWSENFDTLPSGYLPWQKLENRL